MDQSSGQDSEEESFDSRGIPGWDRVDKLAKFLVELQGLCVTSSQATLIKELYADLLEYDKKPLVFPPRLLSPPRGRFGRSKRPTQAGQDHVKQYVTCGIINN